MAMTRRRALAGLGIAALALRRAGAQPVAENDGLRRLFSAAVLQERAARLAAGRDTRPEVKAFAAGMAGWREGQVARLRTLLGERGIAEPGLIREHEAAWEGLEPLDFLALSRRYAEVQVALLEWEIATYEAAPRTNDAALVAYAAEVLPELRRLLAGARDARAAVGP